MKVFGEVLETGTPGEFTAISHETGHNVLGSVKHGDKILINIRLNTRLLTQSAVLNIADDESEKKTQIPFELSTRESLYLTFSANVDTKDICEDNGLFFLSIEIHTEYGIFKLTKTHDGKLRFAEEEEKIPLTVYSSEYTVSDKFRGGIMYHIFPDRFYIGQTRMPKKGGENVEEWNSSIPQYADVPGGKVENNCFYGGNLYGIAEKADYFASLGVNFLYLCPIFESRSNHKYDTGNYMKVDECFGGDKALCHLVDKMKKNGISVILDGVFNHTGDDSIYFNKRGTYDSVGAYNSTESPYYEWYKFEKYPEKYRCWWGIEILPEVDTENKYFTEYICGKYGVVSKYMGMGIAGFRLDVADELSDSFIESFRKRLKNENPQAVLLGEVWEDASTKIAYGKRRKYFRGHQLDGVMNYPLREGIIHYLLKRDSEHLAKICLTLKHNYPEFVFHSLMNFLSTHDTERILSVLCNDGISELTNSQLAEYKASEEKVKQAKVLLKIGYALLYTLPGVPSIYYGDEAGLQGGRDPFNRRTFPWGNEDRDLTEYVKRLGMLRTNDMRFSHGEFNVLEAQNGVFCFERIYSGKKIIICANMSDKDFLLYTGKECYDAVNKCEYDMLVNVPSEDVVFCE